MKTLLILLLVASAAQAEPSLVAYRACSSYAEVAYKAALNRDYKLISAQEYIDHYGRSIPAHEQKLIYETWYNSSFTPKLAREESFWKCLRVMEPPRRIIYPDE